MYGTTPEGLEQVSKTAPTSLASDNTGVVTLTGLQPSTRYYYQASTPGGARSPSGSFRTLPDRGALRDKTLNPDGLFNFSFEFACGNNQKPTGGGGPALRTYDTLLRQHRDEVDFAILNGDWLYEEKRDFAPSAWAAQVEATEKSSLPPIVRIAPSAAYSSSRTFTLRSEVLPPEGPLS